MAGARLQVGSVGDVCRGQGCCVSVDRYHPTYSLVVGRMARDRFESFIVVVVESTSLSDPSLLRVVCREIVSMSQRALKSDIR